MIGRYSYDRRFRPPAPLLLIRLGVPGAETGIMVTGLVDTGADMTVVPADVVRQLALPPIGQIVVRGVGGQRRVTLYAAEVEITGGRTLIEVITLGNDALVGRDLLNMWTVTLDGPARVLRVSSQR